MATSVYDVVEDLKAILNPHTSNSTVQAAYNKLEDARVILLSAPTYNVKLATPPTVVIDLVEEV